MTDESERRARSSALFNRPGGAAPLVMLTAYDYPSARVADAGGVDIVLVGDSAATNVLGYASTREVTLDEMLMLTRAARRGVRTALVAGDLPFGSYEASDDLAVASARKFAEAGCDLVKLEGGGADMVARVQAIIAAGISVIGHVGLLPQGATSARDLRARGRSAAEATAIMQDARALERAGCVAIIVEAVPEPVATEIARRLVIPVIGIGAGGAVDGQVLVYHDLLGLGEGHVPKFVRRYGALRELAVEAVRDYAADVRARRFPGEQEQYAMPAAELVAFRAAIRPEAQTRRT